MKHLLPLVLLLSVSCGGALAPYVPVMVNVAQTVAELVKQRTGRGIDEIPHECEYEFTGTNRLLILCDFDLQNAGE